MRTVLIIFLLVGFVTLGAQDLALKVSTGVNDIFSVGDPNEYKFRFAWYGGIQYDIFTRKKLYLRTNAGISQLGFQVDRFEAKPVQFAFAQIGVSPTIRLGKGMIIGLGSDLLFPINRLDDPVFSPEPSHFLGVLSLARTFGKMEIGLEARHGITPFRKELHDRKYYQQVLGLTLAYSL